MYIIPIKNLLIKNLEASIIAKQALLGEEAIQTEFIKAMEAIIAGYHAGGRLYIAGNGGSAADAQHLAAELVARFAVERAPLPAEALTVDSSILTAISNDYGYDYVFSRQVKAKMQAHDIFLGITTSGNSPNILLALEEVRTMGHKTIIFSGHQGGKIAKAGLADYLILAPGATTAQIQEVHILLIHTLCEAMETHFFPSAMKA